MKAFVAFALIISAVSANVSVRIANDNYDVTLPGREGPVAYSSSSDSAPIRMQSHIRMEPVSVMSLPSFQPAPLARAFVPITRYNQEITGGVADSTSFATGNGIDHSESTRVVAGRGSMYEGENGQMIKSDSSLVKSGSYSYTAADGTPINLSWTADENGFRASGPHLPTPPPLPAAHAEALRTLADASRIAPGYRSDSYSSYAAPAPVVVRNLDYASRY